MGHIPHRFWDLIGKGLGIWKCFRPPISLLYSQMWVPLLKDSASCCNSEKTKDYSSDLISIVFLKFPFYYCSDEKQYGTQGLPWWLSGKESACNAGDQDSIPRSGRCSGKGNGNPLQYSCLEGSMREEPPGRLQSMGLQRVGHDWVRLHFSRDSGIGQGDQLSGYGKILHEDEGCIKMIWRIGEKLLNMF